MNIDGIFDGSNGVLGIYSVNKINYNSTSGELEVGFVYAPYIVVQKVETNFSIIATDIVERKKRKEIYEKRKNVIKKLLE